MWIVNQCLYVVSTQQQELLLLVVVPLIISVLEPDKDENGEPVGDLCRGLLYSPTARMLVNTFVDGLA